VDKSTFVGIFLAVGGIVAGLLIEGGKIAQVLQPTAAIIVFGGTIGAVMVQFPLSVVLQAFKNLIHVFLDRGDDPKKLVQELVGYAQRARKDGIVSLDSELENITDPFLKKTLMLAVDGTEPQELRKMMELELDNQAEHSEKIAQVFESAGGFAPTIGIIGAVLGLIQVMQHLQNIDEVGRGIAVAFVATIYGVGSANLLFLPSSGKLKIKSRDEQVLREMTLEGVISILEGMNPRMLETKLFGYLQLEKQPEPEKAAAKAAGA
jgi:chemotaxis protein MotA